MSPYSTASADRDDSARDGIGVRWVIVELGLVALAVAVWLVRNAGFAAAHISAKGFGETAPAVPNTNDANRQKNRRVVITVNP